MNSDAGQQSEPLVSVCIPTYNCSLYLPYAIESVLRQDYSNFELIVSDNASTDDTRRILETYSKEDSRVKFFINETNLGMVNNWNRCLKAASGKYVKYICADDCFAADTALSTFVRVMESNASIVLAASARFLIDEEGVVKNKKTAYGELSCTEGTDIIKDCLLCGRNKIGEISNVIFRRTDALRGFSTEHHHSADSEMFFHLLEKGDFYFIEKPLTSFRVHSGQQTNTTRFLTQFEVNASISIVERYTKDVPIGLSLPQKKYIFSKMLANFHKKNKRKEIDADCYDHLVKTYGKSTIMFALLWTKLYSKYLKFSSCFFN